MNHITLHKRTPAGALLLALALTALWLLFLQAAPAQAQDGDAAQRAADWLVSAHQNEDGGYSAFSAGAGQAPSDPAGTIDALLALAATGHTAAPLAYLEENAATVSTYATGDPGAAGKLLLALTAAGVPAGEAANFSGTDLPLSITGHLSPTGQLGNSTPYNQALALLGLAAVNETPPAEAVQWLRDQQEPAGSWEDGFGTSGNPDATAAAIMALLASGVPADDPAIVAARDFLAEVQQPGGWEYGPGFGPNANTTALVVQALAALGEDFESADGPWAVDGQSPLDALLAWQDEGGAFTMVFSDPPPVPDFFTTAQALPAAAGLAYPFSGPAGTGESGGGGESLGRLLNPTVAWGLLALALLSLGALAIRARAYRPEESQIKHSRGSHD